MFKKILIADRGEIALRVIRACKEMGIQTVAVHSEADNNSLHLRLADEDVCIGPAPSAFSYRNIPSIISAAEITDSQAIHPGYGPLAENALFAEMCEASGFVFIGPTPETLAQIGDKAAARKMMVEAGVPVIPGSEEVLQNLDMARETARTIGYPVILKAAAGGGGRGMRIARGPEELDQAWQMATSEANAAFTHGGLYLEHYLEKPHHVEIQILADRFGKVIHLGERECSIQRRHQKLIEESPSPVVSQVLRAEICRAAVHGAEHVGYQNAGTVEFLLDGNGNFYFMEMNTRIQVEHPVTEMVSGFDIVKEQIRIAFGEAIQPNQEDIKISGHAIECRINAEDPFRNFTPNAGTITSFHMPGGPGIRVDTHAYGGYRIPPHYDSLLAKLIAHGRTREEAIAKMQRALEEFLIEGVQTTIPFHRAVMEDETFRNGKIDTSYIETCNLEEKLRALKGCVQARTT
ncbi:MAG: acetyl-CoA carboxylase biotin carboxylase subunit [Candidatus Latescibacterota bacterium]